MNIVFDSLVLALAARTGNRSGVYRYSTELIRGLRQIPDVSLRLACSDTRQAPWAWLEAEHLRPREKGQCQSWADYFSSPAWLSPVEQLALDLKREKPTRTNPLVKPLSKSLIHLSNTMAATSFRLKAGKVENSVYHSPFHLVPRSLQAVNGARIIRTIHDVLPLSMPEFFVDNSVQRFRDAINSIGRDEQVLCVSNAVREELLQHQPSIRAEQISVTPLAGKIPADYQAVEDDWLLFQEHFRIEADERLVLALGTLEPRKNLVTLVSALEYLADHHPNLRIRLLVVGRLGWNVEPILARIQASHCRRQILLLGNLPDTLISSLYQRCELSAFVSWGEGFGLPMLEAMQWGTPVVASAIPALQEVGDDAALYVNPASSSEIGDAIRQILEDSKLREQLSKRGLERSKIFSWEKTATATHRCYESILKR